MYLFELENELSIPHNPIFDSESWFVSHEQNLLDFMFEMFGDRKLLFSNAVLLMLRNGATYDEIKARVKTDCERSMRLCLINNSLKYSRMWRAMNEEYNPLWNVEGTETLTYTKENYGTVATEGTNTGTVGTQGTNTGTVGVSGSNTGTVGTQGTNTGTVGTQGTDTGTQTTADGTTKATEHDVTTFDSQTYKHTSKDTETNSGNVTRTDNLAHEETRTDNLSHSETRTDNLSHTETRTDNLAHGETRTDNLAHEDLRTDDLTETYTETKTRGGNIGTTMGQQLLNAELDVSERLKMLEVIATDLVNVITYAVWD